MKSWFSLCLIFLLQSGVYSQLPCNGAGFFTQTIQFSSWTNLKLSLELPGFITVVVGSNSSQPAVTLNSYGITQARAQTVRMGITNTMGSLVATISDKLPTPPVPPVDTVAPEITPNSGTSWTAPWKTAAAGLAVAMATDNRNLMAPLALLPIIFHTAGAQTDCIYVEVILSLPPNLANIVPGELGTHNATDSNNYVVYSFGQSLPGQLGPASCVSDGIQGSCLSTADCATAGLNSIAGLCPGAADIQCCVDDYGVCSANGVNGVCRNMANCGGVSTAGLCPGAANIQCCTSNQPVTPPPNGGSGYSVTAPRNLGVTFAAMTGIYWPVGGQSDPNTRAPVCYIDINGNLVQSPASPAAQGSDCTVRRFLALRDNGARYHSGVDLYADPGTDVIAAESGTIVNAYLFYENVCCVIQQTDSGVVINYGEISCNYVVQVGDRVTAGQKIGTVGHLTCCHAMMHFETYVQGITANIVSNPNQISGSLLNPTEYLLSLREHGM